MVPAVFTGDEADSFTRKIIKDFALEGQDEVKDADGKTILSHKPNGKFTMTPEKTRAAAYEVLKTHLGYDRAAADKFMD